MAVLKLSQIAAAGSPPALTDTVIGVGGGTTDLQYTLTQIKSAVGTIVVGTTPTSGGTSGDILYDNAGVIGESTLTALVDTAFGSAQGDILYRGASAWTVLTPGTSGNFLKTQGASANPIWAAVSAGAGGANTQVQYNSTGSLAGDASFTYAGNGAVTIGAAGHTGSIALTETGGNAVTITPTSATGAWTFKLPTGAGTNTYVLTTDGSGNTSWTAPGSTANLVVGTSTITGGTTGHVVYDNGGVVGEASQFTISSGQPNVIAGHSYLFNAAKILAGDTGNVNLWGGDGSNFSTTGTANTAFGYGLPLVSLTTGSNNVAIGYAALQTATADSQCVAIGRLALLNLNGSTTGNIAIGSSAMSAATGGSGNIAIGLQAMSPGVNTGTRNVAIGQTALSANTSGSNNFGLGYQSLTANLTGGNNVAIGASSLTLSTADNYNVSIGAQSLQSSASGSLNVAIGAFTLVSANGPSGNIAIGYAAGQTITTGQTNTILSYNESTISSGSNNICIGASCGVASATASNQLVIGNYIYGTGLSGTGSTISSGKIGIGTKAPAQQLEVAGNCLIDTDLIVGTGTATNATSGFLYVDSGAGTPTGTPSGYTGTVPMYIDTTNSQLWLYLGGAWKQPKTPAGAALITWQ